MSERRASWRSYGRLLRLSLAPTAVADVLAGLCVAGGGHLPGFAPCALLAGASLAIYHGSMALNDWRDRSADALTRPERPLPSGAIPAQRALHIGLLSMAAGIVLARMADPLAGAFAAVLALLSGAYNLRLRGPWIGPLLIASCRALNLSLGFAFVHPRALPLALWSAPLLYGSYVFLVSRLGRLEDREDVDPTGDRPRRLLLGAALLLVSVAALPAQGASALSRAGALALAAAGAAGLVARARSVSAWSPATIGASVGLALRRLLVFTAALALLTGQGDGLLLAAILLAGFPLSFALRRVFPPS